MVLEWRWLVSAFYPSSTTPRIETRLLVFSFFGKSSFYPSSTTPRIETFSETSTLSFVITLSTHHPLHQGLKPADRLLCSLRMRAFYPSSTTPRIETGIYLFRGSFYTFLSTHHPLHQGLKHEGIEFLTYLRAPFLPIIHYTKDWNSSGNMRNGQSLQFFLPIIHYTKDWNISAKPHNQFLPVTFYPSSTTPRIETYPNATRSGCGWRLSTHHPLHQGLKQFSDCDWHGACKPFYPSSTTPRIETSLSFGKNEQNNPFLPIIH